MTSPFIPLGVQSLAGQQQQSIRRHTTTTRVRRYQPAIRQIESPSACDEPEVEQRYVEPSIASYNAQGEAETTSVPSILDRRF